ncbi:MAG: sulfurtransferase TusA family protein [Firmicutes bacterium]|nr:sulfurtransferase TusA family protein [Bacillota bacterium]
MANIKADQVLDCKGDVCPMPILKTKKAMDSLSSGQVLQMMSTDPGSHNDLLSWCERTGNELIEKEDSGGVFTYYVRKK